MARILILDRATDTLHEADTDDLLKLEGVVDTDNERATWVEYCLPGCAHPVHMNGSLEDQLASVAQGRASCVCPLHVHRSVAMQLKQWPAAIGTAIGEFT